MSWDAWAQGGPVDRATAARAGLQIASAASAALAATLNDLEHDDAHLALAISRDVNEALARLRELFPRLDAPTQLYVDRAIADAEKASRERRAQDHEDTLRHLRAEIQETRK